VTEIHSVTRILNSCIAEVRTSTKNEFAPPFSPKQVRLLRCSDGAGKHGGRRAAGGECSVFSVRCSDAVPDGCNLVKVLSYEKVALARTPGEGWGEGFRVPGDGRS